MRFLPLATATLFLGCLSICIAGCGTDRVAGGSTSETSNGLTVRVVDGNGVPAARARIRIRPAAFLPGTSPATADSSRGIVDTAADDSGKVTISVANRDFRVEAFSGIGAGQSPGDDGSDAVQVRLGAPASLRGRVDPSAGPGRARIQVRGMEHVAWADSDGSFRLDSLPSGMVRLRVWIPSSGRSVEVAVSLSANATTDVGTVVPKVRSGIWTDSVKVVLNTLDGAARIASRVDSSPVLVRLDGRDFPVSARSDGADLQVVDSAGRSVPFSVGKWSPLEQVAHLWVQVPSIHPRDSTQWFRIRWGDSSGSGYARPWDVFDAGHGWSGVWDLDRTFLDRSGRFRVGDASTWSDDGLLTGAPEREPTGGLRFQPSGRDGLAMSGKGTDLHGDFTVLIRTRPERAGSILLGRGDSAWNHGMKEFFLGAAGSSKIVRKDGWYPTFMGWADTAYNVYSVANTAVAPSVWTFLAARHLAGVGDSGAVEWFVDGAKVTTSLTNPLQYETDRKDSLVLGYRHSQSSRFSGAMAEIWILSRAMGDDWILIQSECRKPGGGTLVRLRR